MTVNLVRIPVEERQMKERFGDDYKSYVLKTGKFFPKAGKYNRG